jgi:glc operon protein GlcG
MIAMCARSLAVLLAAAPVTAGGQMPNPYGANINAEAARKVAAAAIAEAKKNGWTMAVAVVDTSGTLVHFERVDNTQVGSIRVAQDKARSSAQFKRPTKAFEDALAGGRQAILGLAGAVPLEGGLPLLDAGKIIGGLGVSGGTSQQDGVAAKAGADALAAGTAAAPKP